MSAGGQARGGNHGSQSPLEDDQRTRSAWTQWTRPTKAIRWPGSRLHAVLLSLLMLIGWRSRSRHDLWIGACGDPPDRVSGRDGFQRPDQPDGGPVRRDGRIFVAEKRGVIKVFDSLTDTTPDVFADLNVNVYNFWDRGLLGMALAPNFPTNPYVYVLYTYDHELGSRHPRRDGARPGSTRTRARHLRARLLMAVLSAPACRGCRRAAT